METHDSENIGFVANPWPLRADRPTLIFVHGSGQDKGFWVHQMTAFEQIANVVALDLPGHGHSQGQGSGSVPGYTQEVAAFIARIEVPYPIPAGLSLGGAITLQLLLDHPEHLAGGILANTGARLKVQQDILDVIKSNYGGFVDSVCAFGLSPQSDAAAMRPQIETFTKAGSEVTFGDFSACNNFDVMDRLAEIQTPVLVLTATDDYLTPPKYGQFMADKIPHARLANIENAGHMAPFEKPAEFNQAVVEYLDSRYKNFGF